MRLGRRQPPPDLLEELHTGRSPAGGLRPPARPPSNRFSSGSMGLLALFAAVVVAAVYAEQGKPPYPALAPSCTTGAIALAPTEVERRGSVRYTLVGPDGDVVLALDTAALSPELVATPTSPGAVTQVFAEKQVAGCRLQGTFPAAVPAGRHEVTAFRFEAGRWTPVASTSLVVR